MLHGICTHTRHGHLPPIRSTLHQQLSIRHRQHISICQCNAHACIRLPQCRADQETAANLGGPRRASHQQHYTRTIPAYQWHHTDCSAAGRAAAASRACGAGHVWHSVDQQLPAWVSDPVRPATAGVVHWALWAVGPACCLISWGQVVVECQHRQTMWTRHTYS